MVRELDKLIAWMWIYNNQRPHQTLGYKTPIAFLKDNQKTDWFPSMQKKEQFEWKSLVLSATN